MTVTLIAVYTVVLVLLKDQWWYVLKLSGARNEPGSHWCVGALSSLRCSLRTQVNRSQVPLEERSTWSNSTIVDLNQKPQSSSVSLDLDLNQATNPASACSWTWAWISRQSSFCLLSIQEKLPVSVQSLPQSDCSLLLIFISIPCYLIKACAI